MATIMERIRPLRTGSQGYTLTELLVVLAIMGLMAALAPPLLQSARHKMLEKSEVFHLAAELQTDHERAIDSETMVRVSIAPDQVIEFFPDGSATPAVIHIEGATVSVAPFSGRVDVTF